MKNLIWFFILKSPAPGLTVDVLILIVDYQMFGNDSIKLKLHF
jgi:hypothetical protein